MTLTDERPRAPLPQELAERFRPRADFAIRAIAHEIEQDGPRLDGPLRELVQRGVEVVVRHAVDVARGGNGWPDRCARVFRRLGEVAFDEGRELTSLHAAYSVGGRVAWRHIAEFGQAHGMPADLLCNCAETVFRYVDELARLSGEGYTAAQARKAGRIALRRRRLLESLLSSPPPAPRTLTGLASEAGWKLPERITAIAIEPGADLTVPDDVLASLDGPEPCLLAAGSADSLGWLSGSRAAVGPTVRLREAASSLRWARKTLALVRSGAIPESPVVRSTDHLGTLCLLGDGFGLAALRDRSLAPLEELTAKQRARLSETLLVWLQSGGSAPELAGKLDIHPQTARYRMRRLTELFGARLDDPDERLNLKITLRAEQLRGGTGGTVLA
ncbi:helix-turn-helix domain-containing protein [Saccharopolyspora taberi]|uniref:Helix-turn-helix domain-containing protein n=1 Tax=Saccharopolyspora taberi TaxID=60895 RepID=A0ABN3VAW9_9PSEU